MVTLQITHIWTERRDLATEMAQEMAYDANGNLQYDLDRRISAIHYNVLNLPELICFMDGRKIVNLYDTAGRKHGTGYYVQDDSLPAYSIWYDGHYERTDYADTLVPSLCRVHHAEGYVSSGREAATPPVIHYYHRDHLGNNCAVWNATADSVVQRTLYYASGMPMAGSTGQPYQPYKYNGKEFVNAYGYDTYDYGFRNYYSAIGRFTSVDPLAEQYYSISPYVYCANNPVKYVDLDGREVKPAGTMELIMIQNTLPKNARDYVRVDKNGLIDRKLLNSYGGKSLNFSNLKTMVNSDRVVEVILDDKFTFMGQDGKLGTATMSYNAFDPKYDFESDKDLTGATIGGLSTGESGFMGKTLFPDNDGIQNSPNGNIIVIVNKNLSPAGAAESYAHEGNGHALLYIQNGGDHKGASHQPVSGLWIEGNKTLMEMIINSKIETIKNMEEK